MGEVRASTSAKPQPIGIGKEPKHFFTSKDSPMISVFIPPRSIFRSFFPETLLSERAVNFLALEAVVIVSYCGGRVFLSGGETTKISRLLSYSES